METTYGMMSVAVDEQVCTVTLNRPAKLNALDESFWAAMPRLLEDAHTAENVHVLVLHGKGRCFSAGADLEGFLLSNDMATLRAVQKRALGVYEALERFDKPTIAAVHGHVLGGGCELTLVCDIVVADETARFGFPEISIGLMPGVGVSRGGLHVSGHWLKDMVLTGEPLDARRAQMAGLATRIVPEGQHLAEARGIARRIAGRSTVAVQIAKRAVAATVDTRAYDYAIEANALLQMDPAQAAAIKRLREG